MKLLSWTRWFTLPRYPSRCRGRTLTQQLARPTSNKQPPHFSARQVAKLCDIDVTTIARKVVNPTDPLPKGELVNPTKRLFTLKETREWIRRYKPPCARDLAQAAAVIAVASHKRGVGKTALTLHLAHALSLKGFRVLTIDCDPQASLTSISGIDPDLEVEAEHTLLPLASGERTTLRESIRPSYFDGVDIVPASIALNGAEFYLLTRDARDPKCRVYNVLADALNADDQALRREYDFVLIDTPPASNYLTISAIWAANGVLSPIRPEGPDFASSAQFWQQLDAMTRQLELAQGTPKQWDWMRVVPSLANVGSAATEPVLGWMRTAYGARRVVAPVLQCSSLFTAGCTFNSLYDIKNFTVAQRTEERARAAYDEIANTVAMLTRTRTWRSPAP